MDGTDITTWLGDNLPQTILLIGGLLAVLIAVTYVKDKDSWKYKGLMFLGFLFGVFMAIEAAIWLGGVTTVSDFDVSFLSENPVRIIVAFILGAVVYGLLNFAEALVKGVGKILNWWPLLLVLGLICIAEAAFMFMGYGSITDYISTGA